MVNFGQVRDWTADAVNEAGTTVKSRKDQLIGLEDELTSSVLSWRWNGDAAIAAGESLHRLNDRAEHIVAEASAVQKALFDASDDVRELHYTVLETDALASANQFSITAEGAIVDNGQPDAARLQLRTQLEDTVTQIMERAGEIDRTLADILTAAAEGRISDEGATSLAEADELIQSQLTPEEILEQYQVDPDPDGMVQYPRNWLMRQILGERTVTAAEADMLDELGLNGLRGFKDIHDDAFDVADERFPSEGNRNDDHNDAFRHAYWNALLVREYGADWAERYGTAHESIPGNEPEREAMDLYNNEIGRQIAIDNPDASPEELADLVEEAVNNGDTVVIPEGGGLDYSDQVEPGETGEPAQPAPEEAEDPESGSTGSGRGPGSGPGSGPDSGPGSGPDSGSGS